MAGRPRASSLGDKGDKAMLLSHLALKKAIQAVLLSRSVLKKTARAVFLSRLGLKSCAQKHCWGMPCSMTLHCAVHHLALLCSALHMDTHRFMLLCVYIYIYSFLTLELGLVAVKIWRTHTEAHQLEMDAMSLLGADALGNHPHRHPK